MKNALVIGLLSIIAGSTALLATTVVVAAKSVVEVRNEQLEAQAAHADAAAQASRRARCADAISNASFKCSEMDAAQPGWYSACMARANVELLRAGCPAVSL